MQQEIQERNAKHADNQEEQKKFIWRMGNFDKDELSLFKESYATKLLSARSD